MNQPHTTTIPVFTIREIRRMAKHQLSGKWLSVLPPMLLFVLFVSIPGVIIQLNSYLSTDLTSMIGELSPSLSQLLGEISSNVNGAAGFGNFVLILTIYLLIATGPFNISLAALSLRVLRNQEYSAKTVFCGFSEFGKGFLTYIVISIFSFLWALLFMIPGSMILSVGIMSGSYIISFIMTVFFLAVVIALLIFLMRYELAFFIAADEDRTVRETVSRSVQLMKGNLSNYFLLLLSFLPWIILVSVPIALALGTFFFSVTGGSAVYSVLCVLFTVISVIGYAFLSIYMETTSAVFYSGLTGNFRSVSQSSPEQ